MTLVLLCHCSSNPCRGSAERTPDRPVEGAVGESCPAVLKQEVRPQSPSLEQTVFALRSQLVRSLALRVGVSPEDAEDLTQDIFLSLLRRGPEAEEIEDIERYVQRAIHLSYASFCRNRDRRRFHTREAARLRDNSTVRSRSESEMESATTEVTAELLRAISSLPAAEREVVELGLREPHLTQKEMAPRLGMINHKAVQYRLSNAKRVLRENLEGKLDGSELDF